MCISEMDLEILQRKADLVDELKELLGEAANEIFVLLAVIEGNSGLSRKDEMDYRRFVDKLEEASK